MSKPEDETLNHVYSNLDHVLETKVVEELQDGSKFAQHAARNFCGYIWYDPEDSNWHEEIWRYHVVVAEETDTSIEDLIDRVNDQFGHD